MSRLGSPNPLALSPDAGSMTSLFPGYTPERTFKSALSIQLKSNPDVTNALLSEINTTVNTPLPSPSEYVKNLDRQFQAARSVPASRTVSPSRTRSMLQASASFSSRSAPQSPRLGGERSLLSALSQSSRRPASPIDRAAQDPLGATWPQVKPQASLSRLAGSVLPVYAGASGEVSYVRPGDAAPRAGQLAFMLQREYVDSLELSQLRTRWAQHKPQPLQPKRPLRFPEKAREVLERIDAWEALEKKTAKEFRKQVQAMLDNLVPSVLADSPGGGSHLGSHGSAVAVH